MGCQHLRQVRYEDTPENLCYLGHGTSVDCLKDGQDGSACNGNPGPGSLCRDNGRLCILVKVGTLEDSGATRLLGQAGILQPFGWFLDLDDVELIFGKVGEDRTSHVVPVFSRNLDVVDWISG